MRLLLEPRYYGCTKCRATHTLTAEPPAGWPERCYCGAPLRLYERHELKGRRWGLLPDGRRVDEDPERLAPKPRRIASQKA